MLELLIELGADLEATDDKARTPLAVALLRGDQEAVRLLRAAGAKEPPTPMEEQQPSAEELTAAANSVKRISPMFAVRDMRATVRWYQSIGFILADEDEDAGELVFARLTFGNGEFTLGREAIQDGVTSACGSSPIGLSHSTKRSSNASFMRQDARRTRTLASSRSGSTKTSIRLSTEGFSSVFVT